MSGKRARLFAGLARLTGAGLPVAKAGQFMREHSRDAGTAEAARALEAGLSEGRTIADALRPALSEMEYRLIGAAESGGRLSEGFAQLGRYHELLAGAHSRLRRLAASPLLILHVAAMATGVVAYLRGDDPVAAIAIAVGLLWAALLLVYGLGRGVVAAAAHQSWADRLVRAMPLVRAVWTNLALSRWSAVMHFHIVSGQPFSTALAAAGGACGSAMLAAATARLQAAAVAGETLADTMLSERAFPAFFREGFATAEISGNLDVECGARAESCMVEATTAMDVLAEWVPRLLYFGALAYGAWMVFQLAGGIGSQYQRILDGL